MHAIDNYVKKKSNGTIFLKLFLQFIIFTTKLPVSKLLNVVTSGLHNNHKMSSSCQQVVLEMMATKLHFLFYHYRCRHEDFDQLYATRE